MWEYVQIFLNIVHLLLACGFMVAAFRNLNKDTTAGWMYAGISIGILTGL